MSNRTTSGLIMAVSLALWHGWLHLPGIYQYCVCVAQFFLQKFKKIAKKKKSELMDFFIYKYLNVHLLWAGLMR